MPDTRDATRIPPADASGDVEAAKPAWVAKSDELVRPVLELMRRFEPERLAALGDPGAAAEVTQRPPDAPSGTSTHMSGRSAISVRA
jgi:hypothetical protein